MPIPIISRTNTIDEWRIQTNQSATALNSLETGNYVKSNGVLTLSGNSSLVITANGTALQVSNNALFQKDVTVSGDIFVGSAPTARGNVSIGGVLSLLGPGNSLLVSNNAVVNSNITIANMTTTNNLTANLDIVVGRDVTVNRNLYLANAGTVLYVNTGVAQIATAIITNTITTNLTSHIATVNTNAVIGQNLTVVSNTVSGNISTNGLVFTNYLRVLGDANVESNVQVTKNVITGNVVSSGLVHTSDLRVSNGVIIIGNETVSGTLVVTSNVTGGNLTTTGTTRTGAFVANGRTDLNGSIFLTGSSTVTGPFSVSDMTVSGNVSIGGTTSIDSESITLRSLTPQPLDSGFSFFGVNRGAYANAHIRWNEPEKYWDIRDVLNANNTYSKIVTANLISDSVSSTSQSTVASSLAANTLSVAIVTANTNLKSYTDTTIATANTNLKNYTDGAISTANTNLKNYTDGAIETANTNLRLYTNSVVTANNLASTNYANTTFVKLTSASQTITGALTVTGNLTVSGTTTTINTQELNVADSIITLNSDVPANTTPSESAGVSVNRGSAANVSIIWNEATDRWTFTNDGSVYSNIGSSAAESYANSAYLHANSAFTKANASIVLSDDTTSNATRYISFTPSTSGSIGALTVSSTKLSFNPSSGRVTATDFFASSDRNLKTDIETIENALTLVNKLRGVTFTWKESGVPGMGVIAQEAEEIIPEVVYEVDGVKSVSYGNLIGLLIESIKELTQEVDYLKQKIDK
jgi:hypothetical protein